VQLVSYIHLGAPATRRPAAGGEPFLRPEVGFTPRWYCAALGEDLGERWHCDPAFRAASLRRMAAEARRRFPGIPIGNVAADGEPGDLLTGLFGGALVAALYGQPIRFAPDNWPVNEHRYLTEEAAARLEPPDLDAHPLFRSVMAQADWIARRRGRIEGYLNWQGVLNNALRIRGEEIFADMALRPATARRVFSCVARTMLDGAQRLYARQRRSGVKVRHFTVSNCVVNMVSPAQYREFLLPFDRVFAREYGVLGIHNCAWNATPWLAEYARIPGVAYVDMGIESDLARARALFPQARRGLMYTPMDLATKPIEGIRADLRRVAEEYAPCDVVFADIEAGTPDARVREAVEICRELSAGRNG